MRRLAQAACCCCNPDFCEQLGGVFQQLDHACGSCVRCTRGAVAKFFCPPGRPSPIFLVYTAVFNLIPGIMHLVAGILLLRRSCSSDCDMGLVKFLFLTVAVNAWFMAFAVHIHKTFSAPYVAPTPEERSPLNRAYVIFMDDPWVSICVLVVIACFPTIFFGFSWDLEGSCPCDPEFPARVGGATFALLFYLLGAGFIACISLSVELYRHRDAETDDPYGPAHQGGILGSLHYFGGAPVRPSADVPSPVAPGGASTFPISGAGYAAYLESLGGPLKPPKAGGITTTYGTLGQGTAPGAGSSSGHQSGYGSIPTEQHGFYPALAPPEPYKMKPGKIVD